MRPPSLVVLLYFGLALLCACPALAARRRSSRGRYEPPIDHLAAVNTRWNDLTYHQQQLQKDVARELMRDGTRGQAFRDQLKGLLKLSVDQLDQSMTKTSNYLGQFGGGDGSVVPSFNIPVWVKAFVVFFSFCGIVIAGAIYIYAMKPGEELTPRAPKRDQDAFKGLLYLLGTAVAGFSVAILGALAGMLGFLWTGGTFIILAFIEVMFLGVFEGNRYVRLLKITRSVPVFNLVMLASLVVCFATLGYGL